MVQQKGAPKGSFLIQIHSDQNATWQGTVNWIEKKQNLPFRSTLELLKLIDGAIESESSDTNPTPEDTKPDKIA